MKSIFLSISIMLFCHPLTFACTCEWKGNFIKTHKNSVLTVLGKVVKITRRDSDKIKSFEDLDIYLMIESMEVEIIEKIKGSEKKRIIKIYAGDGMDCNRSIRFFEKNKSYVFSLSEYKNRYIDYEVDKGTYCLSVCYENWLKYDEEKEEVFGYLKGKKNRKKRKMDYSKFLRKLRLK